MNPEDMISKMSGHTSRFRRIANVVALLAGLTEAAFVSLLWATEPGLPPRTKLAFAAFIVIGLAWAAYGAWALTRRTPMFALDRVIAAWIAVGAIGLLTVTTILVTTLRHRVEPALFITVALLSTLALINLGKARARRSALVRRKRELGG